MSTLAWASTLSLEGEGGWRFAPDASASDGAQVAPAPDALPVASGAGGLAPATAYGSERVQAGSACGSSSSRARAGDAASEAPAYSREQKRGVGEDLTYQVSRPPASHETPGKPSLCGLRLGNWARHVPNGSGR